MSTNLTLADFIAYGSNQTAARTFGERYNDYLNVKDYGAVGDSATDDTAAIQRCFNAAFGEFGSAHGSTAGANKAVYFPAGRYRITKPVGIQNVWGGLIFGDGMNGQSQITYTAGAPVVWASFTASSSGTNLHVSLPSTSLGVFGGYVPLTGILSGTGIPAGTTLVSQTTGTAGSSGVYVTSGVTNSSANTVTASWYATALSLDRVNYLTVRNMEFRATADSTSGSDLSAAILIWSDGIGGASTSAHHCHFDHISATVADKGILISSNPYAQDVDGIVFSHCTVVNCPQYGIRIANENTRNCAWYSGGVTNSTEGFSFASGQLDVIMGISPANNGWTIVTNNPGTIHIACGRTEDARFLKINGGATVHLLDNSQATSGTSQSFVYFEGDGTCIMEDNTSQDGVVEGNGGTGVVYLVANGWGLRSLPEYLLSTIKSLRQWTDPVGGGLPTVASLSTAASYLQGLQSLVRNSDIQAVSSNFGQTVTERMLTLASISSGSPAVFTSVANLPTGANGFGMFTPVKLATTGTLPGPFTTTTQYHPVNITSSQFNLSLTTEGTAINATSTGTGTHSVSNPSSGFVVPVLCIGSNWIIGG